MSGRLYIHIGLGKAGSLAVQMFLNENRDVLAENGFCYPKPPRGHAHHLLAHKWGGGWINADGLKKADIDKRWLELRDEMARNDLTYIISSERFTGATFDAEGVPDFIARLFAGVDTKIIACLRPQEDLAESEYKQRVYSGRIRFSFSEFAARLPLYFDFEALLARWSAIFGSENVIVLRYSTNQVVTDFLNAMGIPRVLPFTAQEKRPNPSIGGLTAQLIVALGLNNRDPDDKLQIEILRNYCDEVPYRLASDHLRSNIRERFTASNLRVARHYLNEQSLFPEVTVLERDGGG